MSDGQKPPLDEEALRDLEQWAGFDLAPNDAELVNALIDEVRAARIEVTTCQRLVEAHQGVAETARRDLAVAYDEIGTLKARVAELERDPGPFKTWSIDCEVGHLGGGIPSLDVALAMAIDMARWDEDDDDKPVRFEVETVAEPYEEWDNGGVNVYRVDGYGRIFVRVNPEERCPTCRRRR